jgi:hypothetical protein
MPRLLLESAFPPLRADQCHRKDLERAPAVLCRRRKSMSRPCKVCAQVNQKFLRYLERNGFLQFPAHGHVTAQMFLQTFGDVTVLGECCLVESFALPVENKSLAELLHL